MSGDPDASQAASHDESNTRETHPDPHASNPLARPLTVSDNDAPTTLASESTSKSTPQPAPRSTPRSARRSQTGPPTRTSQRFVMNKVEKEWILRSLIANGAPNQKQKTLDTSCAREANSARLRHVTDSSLLKETRLYGMCCRREHMSNITAENVRNIVNSLTDITKKIHIMSDIRPKESDGPVAVARGTENDATHILDQAVLDYRHVASKRSLTTDEEAVRVLERNRESQAEKQKRNRERQDTFEKNKRCRETERLAREKRRTAAELQSLRA